MRNLYDFSDNQMNWRSCQNFNMNIMAIVDNTNDGSCDDDEDWFFPQPVIDVPDDITAQYKSQQEPVLPPVIYLSGMDLNCKSFDRKEFNLSQFESWEDFIDAVGKHIYISIVDADNCDFELAQEILSSEDAFNEIIDSYQACL